MAILGSIVKSAITLKDSLTPDKKEYSNLQAEQLRKLLSRASSTAFGIYHRFGELLESENPVRSFQEAAPIYEYEEMNNRWWRQQQVAPDITWPGKPDYFALSSGTTGKESKRIPVTREMLESIRSAGLSQAESLAKYDLPPDLFEKDILMLSSSARLRRHPNGHLEGEISGISTNNIPGWFSGFYKPGLEIARIDDWDERVKAIAQHAREWDVGAIAGIPSWVQMMLRAIIEHHGLDNIHQIWPSLAIYVSGGVAFEPYRQSLNSLMGRPLIYMDTYLASEGFFAYNARPGTMAMKLALEHGIFYEFIPFDERGFDEMGNLLPNPEVLTIGEVEEGQDYALVVSTPAGAWRYMIGDTVKFTSLEEMEIVISGRTKYFLNVVGSQLSEEKMNAAMAGLSEFLGTAVNEFAVAAVRNEQGDFYHQWAIGVENGSGIDEGAAVQKLDETLQQLNKNYGVARRKALKGVELAILPAGVFYRWLEAGKKKGGQAKVPKVMTEEKMKEFLNFAGAAR
ncbi:MAG: GH3 auxin-responsive promoter family protein [Phaeodactylibacter sp.]|nr:GH3 auxin-responsive promoter family protein [Phaeodactylibacter sp.]MCB9266589.1 GH3 auxin-responsive promoter family protein [Lewinellaceae bacterium]MCB9288662.1 GH3 auxin-responsive promoter family protein [Lewinellaceae bacterium]